MIHHVFSVKDTNAETFGRPFFVPAVGVALRSFADEVNRDASDNLYFNHPEDFILYSLGIWDDNSGIFTPHENGAEQKSRAIDVRLRVGS